MAKKVEVKTPTDQTILFKPDNRLNILELLISPLVIIIVCAAMLWHWDGFWRVDLPVLVKAQKEYFPEKYQYEQDKVYNLSTNMIELDEALLKIKEIERENNELKDEILRLKTRSR